MTVVTKNLNSSNSVDNNRLKSESRSLRLYAFRAMIHQIDKSKLLYPTEDEMEQMESGQGT